MEEGEDLLPWLSRLLEAGSGLRRVGELVGHLACLRHRVVCELLEAVGAG